MAKAIIGVIVGLVILISVFLMIDPNVKNNNSSYQSPTTSLVTSNKISVKIMGAVVNPGTYTLTSDDSLRDLITKAGGVVSSADSSCYDENVKLEGHDSFYIPFVSGFSQECKVNDVEKVNINTANKEKLQSINGITSTLADNIIAYRQANGDFKCLEDIINVSGIGTKTFEKIRDYISIK